MNQRTARILSTISQLVSVLVKFISLSQVISFVSVLDAIHRHDFSYNLL